MFKLGILPSTGHESDAREVYICTECGFKRYYYGSAQPGNLLTCLGCLKKKLRKVVKRNPRIINRNNPGPFRR